MAQFIELLSPGGVSIYIRCSAIERVETNGSLGADKIAPPDAPIRVVVRDTKDVLSVFGCCVLDILHGIHRDDCFLDSRGDAP